MIKCATFVSVWDDGIAVESACKVDTNTKEVFDIEISKVEGLEIMVDEYLVIDGKRFNVYRIDELNDDNDTDYWYDF